ncbi:MAG: hypothetical protein AMXMBFR84_07910 [Candidatus Hydrogenedentota bacterium]
MSEKEATLVVTCSCGQKMKVAEEARGKSIKCLRCGAAVPVDAAHQAVASATSAKSGAAHQWSRVVSVLTEEGLVNDAQLGEALGKCVPESVGLFQALVDLGHLDAAAFHQSASKQHGIASIDIANYQVAKDLLALVPSSFARERLVVPIDKLGRLLTVGMACPLDQGSLEELTASTGLRVKPMLCKYEDLVSALHKYYPESALEKEQSVLSLETFGLAPVPDKKKPAAPEVKAVAKPGEAEAGIRQISALPIAPDTLARLEAAERDGQTGVRRIVHIVQQDPALAFVLVAYANLPVFGSPGKMAGLTAAVTLLGAEGVKTVARSAGNSDELGDAWDWPSFVKRGTFAACAAAELASDGGKMDPDSACMGGLVHETGRLALAMVMGDRFQSAPESMDHAALCATEDQLYALNHGQAGYLLAQRWGFPNGLPEAIRFHGNPAATKESRDFVNLVALAAAMAEAFLAQGEQRTAALKRCEPLLAPSGAETRDIRLLFDRSMAAYARVTEGN